MMALSRGMDEGVIIDDRFELRVVAWTPSNVRLAVHADLNGTEDTNMLALARSEGQSIIIDGNIEVKVVKWSRSSVRLAIQAPREVTVDRDEVWRKMHPGEQTPLEKAEQDRKERFAREAAAGAPKPQAADGISVTAPAAGTFYASAGPGGAAFVSVGSAVEPEAVVGSLKTAQGVADVHAGTRGTVQKLLVTNGQAVAEGQPLILIKPAE